MSKTKIKFRDVSYGLQKLRDFLLGRKHTLHGRFPPMVAPRTLPPAEVPRGPELKYSDIYYTQRSAFNSVHPPVIAPVAEGPPLIKDQRRPPRGAMPASAISFNFAPTPGPAWWWDGHCYYEEVLEPPPPIPPAQEDESLCPKPEEK